MAARRARLCRRSSRTRSAHAWHVRRPSLGGALPHLAHMPDSISDLRLSATSPASLPAHPAQNVCPSLGGSLPHCWHSPASLRRRRYDCRSPAHRAQSTRPLLGGAEPHVAHVPAAIRPARRLASAALSRAAHAAHAALPSTTGDFLHLGHILADIWSMRMVWIGAI